MYGSNVVILLKYGSHDMRHAGFRRLTVVNKTLGIQGVTISVFILVLNDYCNIISR